MSGRGRTPLLNVCVTRWVENIDGWDRFSTGHPFLVKMCEVILCGDPDYSLYNDNWPAEHKKNALAYLKFLEYLELFFCMVTLSFIAVLERSHSPYSRGRARYLVWCP